MNMTITEHLTMWTWKVVVFLNITAIRIAYNIEKLFITVLGKEQ